MFKIMAVDDSNIIRNRIARCFTNSEFEVTAWARNGCEAIDRYKECHPDVVTMDLTMPQMNGLQCIKELIALDPNALILVVSALSDHATALAAIRAGARGFINKPFTDDELRKALSMLLHPEDIAEP